MQSNDKLKNSLKQTALIVKKYEEAQKITGERFNIFSILDKERDEERTHSAFIGELLNPKGSHAKGKMFLNLFERMLLEKAKRVTEWKNASIPNLLDDNTASVHLEKYVGKQYNIGSRLDIFVDYNDFTICIENKIDAKDTELQLERYSKYLKEQSKKGLLIYLTPNGREYEKQDNTSELKVNEGYFCLSYETDILGWLENCAKESYNTPVVREAIQQYIYLIQKITNQLTSNTMSKEIDHIILSDLKSAETINNRYFKALQTTTDKLKADVIEKLRAEYNLGYIESKIYQNRYSSIFFRHPMLIHNVGIESFLGTGHKDGSLFIGLIEFDKDKRKPEHHYNNGGWLDNSIRIIWDKNTLFEKIEKYNKYPQEAVNELVGEILKHMNEFFVKFSTNTEAAK